jgi:outer membrane protein TolC
MPVLRRRSPPRTPADILQPPLQRWLLSPLWCAALLSAAPALAQTSAALSAANPATPVTAATVAVLPPATPAQPLELPADMERARAIWQRANQRVAEFPRGHIDIIRWEAQNPGSTPASQAPASTGPTLDVAEAVRMSLRHRPALLAHTGMSATERAEVQRAYVAHVQAVHSAWVQAVTARHSLRLMSEALSAASTGVALGQRMVMAGNWSQAKLLREQVQEAAAHQAAARAQQAKTSADEQLARLLGEWNGVSLAALLERLPSSLPALPEQVTPGPGISPADVESAALRGHPTLGWQLTEARRQLAGTSPAQLAAWREAVDAALATSQKPDSMAPWTAPQIDNLPLLRDHALERAVRAESALLQAAAERRSMAREAWAQLQAQLASARHAQDVVSPLQTTLEQETLLGYNGMLQSTWDLLAQARERLAALDAAHQARRDFWLAHTAWQALLAGGDYQSPGTSSAPAGGTNPAPKGH